MSTIFASSVRIIACRTLTICAMLALRTRSAWRAKMFRLSAARTASRRLFCWTRKPGWLPGSGAYHAPHSSTTRPIFFSGSYLSMMAACVATMSSIWSVDLENLGVLLLAKPGGRVRRRPLHHGVVVERQAVDVPAPRVPLPGLHDDLGPLGPAWPVAAGTHGDVQHPVGAVLLRRVEVPDEAAVDLELVQVVLGCHVSTAVPALVPDPEVGDPPGVRASVGRALLGQGGRLVGGHVLEPLRGLPGRPRADVDGEVGLTADLLHEVHELVEAEGVGLGHAAPVGVEGHGPVVPDAVAPVILVGEAAPGPPHVGHPKRLERRHHVVPDAPGVGDGGVRSHPDPLVDAVAEVLGELPEDVAVDRGAGPGRIDGQDHLVRGRDGRSQDRTRHDHTDEKEPHRGRCPLDEGTEPSWAAGLCRVERAGWMEHV